MKINRSTLLHLRIPFSLFLMPVYAFALSQYHLASLSASFGAWAILHLLVFPASNGYNSYFDRDTDSIGGLRRPPQVQKALLWVSLAMDLLAVMLSFFLALEFAVMVFVYGLASKAYSHPAIRLKKFPFLSAFTTTFFQGFAVYVGCLAAWGGFYEAVGRHLFAGLLSSVLILGAYPLTQVYQHRADALRGDMTLSRRLGLRGTFMFSGLIFGLVAAGFGFYFYYYSRPVYFLAFVVCLLPVLGYFAYWVRLVWKDERAANFDHTMRLNLISALAMIAFFMGLWSWERFYQPL